uniref:RGS domain-containing protein n=1 Tax=Periophthalmus magnuspinnatus TaxID=409849 RepID=A0A3B4ARJ3_9GOBI
MLPSSGLTRSLSEGSLLQEPRSPHLLSHSPVLTWPLRASLAPETSGVPRPSVLTLKKHLTEGGSLHRALELLYGSKVGLYGLAVFRHFLRSEFSEENLDFWLAVEKFKRTCPQKMVFKATRIYNEFISCNATRQVNIDSAVRELTNQSLSLRISPSVFRLAQEQIYNLMLTDSYPRFLKSHLYTQLANQNLQQGQKLP